MTFSQFLAVLLARRTSAILLGLLIVSVVAIASWLQPKQYLATASLMIDSRNVDPVAAPGAGGYGSTSAYMATQIDLIQSERVARRAATALGLPSDAAWRARWTESTLGRGDYDAWTAEQLSKRLEVRPSRESSVVNVGYAASDPAFAAAAANAFVDAYMAMTLDLKVGPAKQYNSFFDDRARQLRQALEQAQGRLSAYQQAKGIVATDERLDVENARLSELSSQVVLLQGLAAESSGRRNQSGANSSEVLANQMIGTITADMSRQEARLTELKQRLGERHPQVLELTANVEQLRARLETETSRVSNSLVLNSNVDRSRLGAAQAALNEQRARVLRLRGQRDESAVLLRDVDGAQRAYDAALGRVTQTGMESQNTLTNITVLKTASAPPFATSPRPLLNVAVAAVVATLLGVAFALLRERRDRRLRFDSDVAQVLRQDLLISLPRSAAGDAARLKRLDRRKSRVLSGLPRVAS